MALGGFDAGVAATDLAGSLKNHGVHRACVGREGDAEVLTDAAGPAEDAGHGVESQGRETGRAKASYERSIIPCRAERASDNNLGQARARESCVGARTTALGYSLPAVGTGGVRAEGSRTFPGH